MTDRRMATRAQMKRIYAMWWTLGEGYCKKGNEARALSEFLKRRFFVRNENVMDYDTAQKVIEEIVEIKNRGSKKEAD